MALLDPINIVIAFIVLGVLAMIAYKVKIVTKSGLVAAFFLGLGIWLLASWTWFLLILLFFAVSALFTRYKYQMKRQHGAAQEKGGAREWSHVLANGLLPLLIVIIAFSLIVLGGRIDAYGRIAVGFGPIMIPANTIACVCFAAFLGALATTTADTLATEIGLLNPTPPRLITKLWKVVQPGTSGGVSIAGEIATIFGTLLIGGVAALLAAPIWISVLGTSLMPELIRFAPITIIIVSLVGGFIGCTIDSIFGATIQGMWRCRHCHKQTEKRTHCGEAAEYLRGNRFMDNHMVNLISSLIGGVVAASLYLLLLTIGLA